MTDQESTQYSRFILALIQDYEIIEGSYSIYSWDVSLAFIGGYIAMAWSFVNLFIGCYQNYSYERTLISKLYTEEKQSLAKEDKETLTDTQ